MKAISLDEDFEGELQHFWVDHFLQVGGEKNVIAGIE